MKRVISILLSAVLLVSGFAIHVSADGRVEASDTQNPATLIVNGSIIEGDTQAILHIDEAENNYSFDIPLIATIKALGGHVIWISETRAIILYKGLVLQLDTKEESVFFFSPEMNYFELVAGGLPVVRTRRQEGHEFIVDDHAAQSLFTLFEVKMVSDYENAVIQIDAEGRTPGLDFWVNLMVPILLLPFLALDLMCSN